MKQKFYETTLFKSIVFGVLFILASMTTRMGFVLIVPIFTSGGRYVSTHLPAILALWMPLLCLIFLWMRWNTNDKKTKWLITFTSGLLITGLNAVLLADHIIMSALEYHWVLHATETSPLFPFDIMVLLIVFLCFGIAALVEAIITRKDRLEERLPMRVPNKTIVAVWFYLPFACYFNGAAFSVITSLPDYDPNWPFMIPALLAFFLMIVALYMYVYAMKGDEEGKKKRWFNAIVITLASIAFVYIWIGIGVIVNPYLFPESLSQYYTLGYAIKIPFGLFLTGLGALIPCIVSIVKYCKTYPKKK